MPIIHHASDELLLAYAAGRLGPAPALVVASHLAMSDQSAARMAVFERLGGALLDEQPMAELAPDLFDRTIARLREPAPSEPAVAAAEPGRLALGIDIPAPLAARSIGRWRPMAPGMRFATVDVPEDPACKVLLLRIKAGMALPRHGHGGSELTLVLKGDFSDETGTYGPGDIAEEDSTTIHHPKVGPGGECICLTAIEGRLRPDNWLARIAMQLFGL